MKPFIPQDSKIDHHECEVTIEALPTGARVVCEHHGFWGKPSEDFVEVLETITTHIPPP